MKFIFKNFLNTVRRYKLSTALNVVGLSVALAAAMLIAVQLHWDLTFDRAFPDAERIVRFETTKFTKGNAYGSNIPLPMGEEIARMSGDAVEFTYSRVWTTSIQYAPFDRPDAQTEVSVLPVPQSFTSFFGLRCVEGSLDRLDEPGTAVLPQSRAEALFGGRSAVGQVIVSKEDTLTVTGVYADLPLNTFVGKNPMLVHASRTEDDNWKNWNYVFFYKLSDPSARQRFSAEVYVGLAQNQQVKERFEEFSPTAVRFLPLLDTHFAPDVENPQGNWTITWLLLAVGVLVVSVAAINFVNFFMAMVPVRIRSIQVSKVFGAPTALLRWGVLTESVGITLVSCSAAFLWVALLGPWANQYVNGSVALGDNMWLVCSALMVSVVLGLAAGLWPAFYITRFGASTALKGAFGSSRSGRRLRAVLVGAQFVVSIALVAAAAFMVLQTRYMKNYDLGFRREYIFNTKLSKTIASQQTAFKAELKKSPAVADATFGWGPLIYANGMSWGRGYKDQQISFACFPVSWNFAQFMGLKVYEGRDFTEEDEAVGSKYLFNETAARAFGMQVGETVSGHFGDPAEIVGFVRDFNFESLRKNVAPIAFYIMGPKGWKNPDYLYVRTVPTADPGAVMEFVDKTMRAFDPTLTDVSVVSFDEQLNGLYQAEERQMTLVGVFSALAVVISLLGVVGLVVFEAQHRQREIALRKVHGADSGAVVAMFNRRFVRIVLFSSVAALPLAWWGVSRWLEGFAYRVPLSWWVFAASVAVVAVVVVGVVSLLTWKAARRNPIESLKTE